MDTTLTTLSYIWTVLSATWAVWSILAGVLLIYASLVILEKHRDSAYRQLRWLDVNLERLRSLGPTATLAEVGTALTKVLRGLGPASPRVHRATLHAQFTTASFFVAGCAFLLVEVPDAFFMRRFVALTGVSLVASLVAVSRRRTSAVLACYVLNTVAGGGPTYPNEGEPFRIG